MAHSRVSAKALLIMSSEGPRTETVDSASTCSRKAAVAIHVIGGSCQAARFPNIFLPSGMLERNTHSAEWCGHEFQAEKENQT